MFLLCFVACVLLITSGQTIRCPRCVIYETTSPYGRNINTCSRIVPDSSRWRNCYGGKVCKKLTARTKSLMIFGPATHTTSVHYDCYRRSDNCWKIFGRTGSSNIMMTSCVDEVIDS